MTTSNASIGHAVRLLREAASEISATVSIAGVPDWANEPEAEALWKETTGVAAALEAFYDTAAAAQAPMADQCLPPAEERGAAVGHADSNGRVTWFDPIPEAGALLYAAPPAREFPAMTPQLASILGLMCFECIHFARALRMAGQEIKSRAEDEQAAVLHWMLGHYFRHGEDWRKHASEDMERMRAVAIDRAAQTQGGTNA